MEQRDDRDKKGTGPADVATVIKQHVDVVPAAGQLWDNIRAQSQSRGGDAEQWLAERAAAEIQRLASPGARDNFEALCRNGCHPLILGLFVKGLRQSPEVPADLRPFTGDTRKLEARARKLDKTAALIEDTFADLPEDVTGMIQGVCTVQGRLTPAQLAFELRHGAMMMRIAQILSSETKARDLEQALLYLLCGYVLKATGSQHDLDVSGLIAEIRQDVEYNENALRQWRYRNVPVLDAGVLANLRLVDLLDALGNVIPIPT